MNNKVEEGAGGQFEVAPYNVQGAGRREVSEVSLCLRLVLDKQSCKGFPFVDGLTIV